MPEFSVNTHRHHPYPPFRFSVKWENREIPGIIRVSGLRRLTEVIEHRSGQRSNVVQKAPGISAFAPLVLVRRRTHDTAFEDWAQQTLRFSPGGGDEVALRDFRKNISIELRNEAGQIVMAFQIYDCWPSEYSALDELDAGKSTTATETLVLQYEGWLRDLAVTEPQESSYRARAVSGGKGK